MRSTACSILERSILFCCHPEEFPRGESGWQAFHKNLIMNIDDLNEIEEINPDGVESQRTIPETE
ncbi:MAG: hypothetical protein AAFV25_15230, partial [Bacteroidota bacterium]